MTFWHRKRRSDGDGGLAALIRASRASFITERDATYGFDAGLADVYARAGLTRPEPTRPSAGPGAGSEPAPVQEVLQFVIDSELRLLQPEVRRSADQVEALLHPDFYEFGPSGRKWDRPQMMAALDAAEWRNDDTPAIASEMAGTRLADDVVLVTYLTQRGQRRARHSSLWRRTEEGWRLYFHQGTLLPND